MNTSAMAQLPDGSGCFTATILSQAEIDALPIKKRPISARISSEMYHAVFEKVGTASMAWKPRPTGVFDTELASKVAVDLCFIIAGELEKREQAALLRAADIAKEVDITSTDEEGLGCISDCAADRIADAITEEAKKFE